MIDTCYHQYHYYFIIITISSSSSSSSGSGSSSSSSSSSSICMSFCAVKVGSPPGSRGVGTSLRTEEAHNTSRLGSNPRISLSNPGPALPVFVFVFVILLWNTSSV